MIRVEYIWIDGTKPTPQLRGKTKFITDFAERMNDWIFDGSSTYQAVNLGTDCILRPVKTYIDPRYKLAFIVLCEVYNINGTPHSTNTRRKLVEICNEEEVKAADPVVGFEQEYFIMQGPGRPLGFPKDINSYPPPQGPYYCGVGGDRAFGRNIADAHANDCIETEISICGVNAEVAPGQWEYQIGGPDVDIIKACDDLWVSRYLLMRHTEGGYFISLEQKPVAGDWNGSGMHTNFSTIKMRMAGGIEEIEKACEKLSKRVQQHLDTYGHGYESRLTGKHETARYDKFSWGVSDRAASVRIPYNVARDGCGYFEDRRPGANADPYRVAHIMIDTVVMSGT